MGARPPTGLAAHGDGEQRVPWVHDHEGHNGVLQCRVCLRLTAREEIGLIARLLPRAIVHDSEAYSNPGPFKPERFLSEVDGKWKIDPSILDPYVPANGAGQR